MFPLFTVLLTSLFFVDCIAASRNDKQHNEQMSELFDCSGRPDGTYPDFQRACRLFYACAGGNLHVFWCRNGTVFDPERRHCDLPSTVRCRHPEAIGECSELSDGAYTDYASGCRQFFFCNRGHKTLLNCPPKSLFDWQTGSCRPSNRVSCEPLSCDGRQDGFYPDVRSGCKRYISCDRGKMLVKVCPQGQIFNVRLLRCTPHKGVRCQAEEQPTMDCLGLPDGYYPDLQRDCRTFYHCHNGRSKTLNCPSDLVFTTRLLACVHPWKSAVQCQRPDPAICQGKPNGIHPFYNRDCREFVVCREGWPLLVGACSPGQVLSPLTSLCQPQPLVTCAPVKDPDCDGRSDGLFPDISTSCSSFYVCLNGRRALTSYCKGSTRFDQATATCLPTPLVFCNDTHNRSISTTPFRYDCRGRIGFFPDFESRCHGYRMCAGSYEQTLVCPEGSRFDLASGQCRVESDGCQAPIYLASFRCLRSDEGIFVDSGCRQWHECRQQRGRSFACPSGHRFNVVTRRCAPELQTPCVGPHPEGLEPVHLDDESALCMQSPNGVFASPDGASFYLCALNKTFAFSCPPNSTFHDDKMRCLPSTISINVTFSCDNRSDGMYPDASSMCQRYFVCERGRRTVVFCSEGERFNRLSMVCEPASRVPCGSSSTINENDLQQTRFECPSDQTGFFPDYPSNCRKFHACFRAIRKSYDCPSVLRFNPKTKNCDLPEKVDCRPSRVQTHVHGVPSHFVFRCSGRADGFYADYARHCHVFYRCLRGQKFSHYCKPGLLFNPLIGICDLESNVVCKPNDDS